MRGLYARQREIIARYEKLFSRKVSPEFFDDLAKQRAQIESLRTELRHKLEDLQSKGEELEAYREEVLLSLDQQSSIEKNIIRAERDFRAIVEKNADAMVVLDADGYVQYVNPATKALFDLTAAEMVDKQLGFPIVLNDPVEMYVLRGFRSFVAVEMRMVEVAWNERPSYLISLRDMTDRTRAEQALSRSRDRLDVAISARTRELSESNERLKREIVERKNAEKALEEAKQQAELYLDLMGHDINNMHQIALGYLELAKETIQMDQGQREYIEKPVEVLQRSARLIGNVRKMQKILDGSLQEHVIDLCEVLPYVQREFGAMPRKPVTLTTRAIAPCNVRANELLYDVFSNLMTNAIKHTGDQADIAITLEEADEDGGRSFRVSVADGGPGIPDDFKAQIFNRMLKGTDKAKGMGLGLYLVKSLVDSYGGKVWVEDRVPGDHTQGARFVVLLPAAEK